jgi:hypothetical protein
VAVSVSGWAGSLCVGRRDGKDRGVRTGAAGAGVVITGALVAGALFLTGAPASSAPGPALPVACTLPHGPGPGYNASIGNQQNGGTICVTVGEKLLVLLSAPPGNGFAWRHIVPSPSGILFPAPLTITVPRGATATDFFAKRQGVVKLASQRAACRAAPTGSLSCGALVSWQVTLIVSGPHKYPVQPEVPAQQQ